MLLAETECGSVGFIIARFIFSSVGENLSMEYSEAEADILNIGVRKKFRKQGIGKLLLNSVFNKARDLQVESIWLEARKSNLNAIKFYAANGFEKTQERKNFYTNPTENAVIMCLKL